ncbi:MAG: HK97 family phage prohead protease [Alphaproteobacteria bacterium]|nr:HK97 family phage prohead protease [Alphaproteobacteria bacterium]
MKLYGEIQKIDDEQRMVFGYASTESVDSQGEIVTKSAVQDAWDDYMKFANVREMHQPSAVGIVKEYNFDDSGVQIGVHVVDDNAWEKVKKGVYRGFSIGGKKLPGGYDKATNTISKMRLTEISLVDRPANPEAVISMWKGEDIGGDDETELDVKGSPESVAALVELVNKGDISLDRVVELANEDIAKAKKDDGKDGGKDKPYGDVEYADTKNNAYPIDTEKHIRAAWSYINMPKNQKDYSDAELKTIKDKIIAAWKDKIDKDGPPSADDTEKFAAADDVRKGMYSLQSFANVISCISDLACSAEYEAAYEGDQSPIPEQLRKWLADGVEIFKDMAEEETSELLAALQPKTQTVAVDVAMADTKTDIIKGLTGEGATVETFIAAATGHVEQLEISKALFDDRGTIGTHMKALADTIVAKLNGGVDIAKMAKLETDLKKMTDERDGLAKRVQELEAQPAPSKVSLRATAIEKSADVVVDNSAKEQAEETIIKKADGTVDEEATAHMQIKKIHQSSGFRLAR